MTGSHSAGIDTGYTFHGPKIVDRTMPLSNGLILEANHQSGVVVSEDPDSPLRHATLYAQGTTVSSAGGSLTHSAAFCSDQEDNHENLYSRLFAASSG
jgi:hypothetical protein